MDTNISNNIELTTQQGPAKKEKVDKPYKEEIPEEILKLFGKEVKKDDKR